MLLAASVFTAFVCACVRACMCVWERAGMLYIHMHGYHCVCKAASTHEHVCVWRLADSLGCYSMHVFPLSVERGLYSLMYVAVIKFPAQFSLRRKSLFGLQFQVITHPWGATKAETQAARPAHSYSQDWRERNESMQLSRSVFSYPSLLSYSLSPETREWRHPQQVEFPYLN